MKIKLGIRPSRLAFKQAEEVIKMMPAHTFDITTIETEGDRDKRTPLFLIEKSDFFTKDLEKSLLNGAIDAAIHSAKDIEEEMPSSFVIAALTAGHISGEALVSRMGAGLKGLPEGAFMGTSSRKRKESIMKIRDDLVVRDVRGTIEERLEQLFNGDYDAIIMAAAALIRLGLEHLITELIPKNIMEPHPLQGRLAVQILKERNDLREIFKDVDGK